MLDRTDAFRRPERFEKFLLVCEADARGRTGLEDRDYPQADYVRNALRAANDVEIGDLKEGDLTGADIGKAIHARHISAIEQFVRNYEPPK
jgi:tRNA nucleotidyltransferase (CCA-adding enzyme)